MKSEYICIICPNGCDLEVEYEGEKLLSCTGNSCPRGLGYAESMITDPVRSVTSSVPVSGGAMPLVSVRTSKPVPKRLIFGVMDEIRKVRAEAPVTAGQVIISGVLGTDADIIATRSVEKSR